MFFAPSHVKIGVACKNCRHTSSELDALAESSQAYLRAGPFTYSGLVSQCRRLEHAPVHETGCDCRDMPPYYLGIQLCEITCKFPAEELRLIFLALSDATHPDHGLLWHGLAAENDPVSNSLDPEHYTNAAQRRVFAEFACADFVYRGSDDQDAPPTDEIAALLV